MKALTIWQPWAGLILCGAKPIENRTWIPGALAPGERFAIHGGKPVGVEEWVTRELTDLLEQGVALPSAFESGCLLGTVQYAGVVRKIEELPERARRWWTGPLAWRLASPAPWDVQIQVRGRLGLWEIQKEIFRNMGVEYLR